MKKRLIPLAVLAAAMASCSSDDVIEANPDPSGNALTFSIAVGHSRATETTLPNLGDFNVVAKGVHPHGGVYDNFLIGSSSEGVTAFRDGTSSIWKFVNSVYWPTSFENVIFWAYTCSQNNGTSKSAVLPSGTYGFEGGDAKITGFSPEKADLTAEAKAAVWQDGYDQKDLLSAFTFAERSKGTNVNLDFNHALSQIEIKAASLNKSESDHRIVRIKGAWIVNTKDVGDLSSGYTWANGVATHSPQWTSSFSEDKQFTAYGSFYKSPILLDGTTTEAGNKNLLIDGGSLMLIPQTIEKWNTADAGNNAKNAYILLLCRVELKHSGAIHTGGDPLDPTEDDDIVADANYHYHQMFPVNKDKKFVEGEYGFVCVPIGATFDMGKKYVFNLDICGAASGAGIYPPENDFSSLLPTDRVFSSIFDDENTITLTIGNRPTNKNVGDNVLDEPIQFKVTVKDWDENKDWSEGNIVMPK